MTDNAQACLRLPLSETSDRGQPDAWLCLQGLGCQDMPSPLCQSIPPAAAVDGMPLAVHYAFTPVLDWAAAALGVRDYSFWVDRDTAWLCPDSELPGSCWPMAVR